MKKSPATVIQVRAGARAPARALTMGPPHCHIRRVRTSAARKEKASVPYNTPARINRSPKTSGVYMAAPPHHRDSMTAEADFHRQPSTSGKILLRPDSISSSFARKNRLESTYVSSRSSVYGRGLPPPATMPGTAAVVNAVSNEKSASGWGAAYATGKKILKLKKYAASPA